MRIASVLLAVCCWLSAASGQWLEKVLYLPDSLSGVTLPCFAVHNSVNNKVYVTGKYGMYNRAGRDCWIVVLDGATNQRIARIAVPSEVGSLAYNATENKIYAASFVDSSVTVIDGSADTVLHRLWLRHNVIGMYWERTMDKLYCGHLSDSSITVLDAEADTVTSTIRTTCRPSLFQASPEFGKLYCGRSRNLAIVDYTADTVIGTLNFATSTVAMSYDSARQRVFCVGGRWVNVVDAVGDSVIIASQVAPVNHGIYDVELGAQGAKLYCKSEDTVFVLDPVTIVRTAVIKTGSGSPEIMCYDPRVDRLFLPDGNHGRIRVIDCVTDSVVTVLDAGVYPTALCFDSIASKVYCVNNWSDDVTVVDCVGDSVAATVAVGSHPSSLCYSRTFGKLYCADSTNGLVSVMSGQENRVVKNIWAGYGVTGICVGDSGAKVYCLVPSDSIVAAIDCANDSVVARVRVDSVPAFIRYVPERNRIYCGSERGGQGTLAAIDCATDSVVATVDLVSPASALCYNSVEDKMYCGAGQSANVEVISCAGDTSLGLVSGARCRYTSLYNAGFNKAYLPYQYWLYIVDGEADTVRTVKSSQGGNIYSMCLNPLQQKIYVPFSYDSAGRLMVIDAATDSVLKDVSPESCYAVCYDSINNTVYMSDNFDFGTVRVINCVNDVVTDWIPVGLRPTALEWNPDQNRMYVLNSWSGSISVLRDSFPPGIGAGTVPPARSKPLASIVRGVLFLPDDRRPGTGDRTALLDIAGREVLDLRPGANDVRSLAPGVYFVREEPQAVNSKPQAVRKVIITE